MTQLWRKLFEATRKRRWLMPLLLLGLLAFSALGAARLRFTENIFELLPKDDPVVAESRLALDRFHSLERIVIDLECDDKARLLAAVDECERRLKALEGIRSVTTGMEEKALEDVALTWQDRWAVLFDEPMQRAVESRCTREEFRERLEAFLAEQTGAEGISIGATAFRNDPFDFNSVVLRRFERLNSGFDARMEGGHLLSRDGRHALIVAEADFPAGDTGRGRVFMQALTAQLDSLGEGVTARVIGGHRSSVDNAEVLQDDIHLTVLTSVLGVLLLFLLAFRGFGPIVVTLLSVGFGFGFALGVQGFLSGELSAITAGFSAVLLGIAVDYAIHLSISYANSTRDKTSNARSALDHVAKPATLAMLTTVAALLVLRLSNFEGLLQLSGMAVSGLLGALFFALGAGPHLLAWLDRSKDPSRLAPVRWFMGAVESMAVKGRWALMVLAVLATLVTAAFLPQVSFDGDVTNLDGKSDETREAEAVIREVYGGETLSRTLVIVSGENLEAALRQNDLAARELDDMGVERHEGISWVLPSTAAQRENVARWRRFWTAARVEKLREEMSGIEVAHPQTGRPMKLNVDRFFADFFGRLRAEEEPPLLDAAVLHERPVWKLLGNYVIEEADGRVSVASTAALDEAQAGQLKARVPSALVLAKARFVRHMVGFVQRDLLILGGVSLLLVILLLRLAFRRTVEILLALIPVLGGLCWTLGAMGLLGIPFNLINTLVTVFVAGLGIDYGIFFVQSGLASAEGEAAERRKDAGGGVLVAALTTLFGFGSLVLANHPALFSVGVTTTIGILSALFLTLFVVSPLTERWRGRDS